MRAQLWIDMTQNTTAPRASGPYRTMASTMPYPRAASFVRDQLPVEIHVTAGTIRNRPTRAATSRRI